MHITFSTPSRYVWTTNLACAVSMTLNSYAPFLVLRLVIPVLLVTEHTFIPDFCRPLGIHSIHGQISRRKKIYKRGTGCSALVMFQTMPATAGFLCYSGLALLVSYHSCQLPCLRRMSASLCVLCTCSHRAACTSFGKPHSSCMYETCGDLVLPKYAHCKFLTTKITWITSNADGPFIMQKKNNSRLSCQFLWGGAH